MLVKLFNHLIDKGCLGNGNSIGGWIAGDGDAQHEFRWSKVGDIPFALEL